MRPRQRGLRGDEARAQAQRLGERRHRVLVAALAIEHDAQVVMRARLARRQPERFAERLRGLGVAVATLEVQRERFAQRRIVGPLAQRASQ